MSLATDPLAAVTLTYLFRPRYSNPQEVGLRP